MQLAEQNRLLGSEGQKHTAPSQTTQRSIQSVSAPRKKKDLQVLSIKLSHFYLKKALIVQLLSQICTVVVKSPRLFMGE